MNRFAFAAIAVLLAAWAAIGYRGEVSAPGSEIVPLTLVRDQETLRLLNQFEQIQRSLSDSRDDAFALNNKRRLMEDARIVLEAARNRLVTDQLRWQQKLEEDARSLRENNQRVQSEWGRLLAQSARDRERWLESMKIQFRQTESESARRFVIVDRTLFPGKSAVETYDPNIALSHSPMFSPYDGTVTVPSVDLYGLARTATAYEIPEHFVLKPSTEQRLDTIVERLESMDKRFKAVIAPERAFGFDAEPTVVAAEPPLRWDPLKPNTMADSFSFSWQATAASAKSKSDTATSMEKKLNSIMSLLERMDKRMAEFESQKPRLDADFTAHVR